MSEPTTGVFLTADELNFALMAVSERKVYTAPQLHVTKRRLLDKLREAQKVNSK